MRKLLILLSVFTLDCYGATITATSCAQPAVETAISAAANGDTVAIPAGACTWTALTPISKQIRLVGAGVASTVITASGSGNVLQFTIGSQSRTELAGISFLPGSATGNYVEFFGAGLPPYMHDMKFNIPNFQLQHAVGWNVTGGVISKVTFESTQNLGGACGEQIGSESGSLVVKPGISWDTASTMGMADVNGDKNLYIEDSVFSNVGQIPDLDDNARAVVRHNTIISSSGLTHGTTGPQGGRHVEIYDNTFTLPNKLRAFNRFFWFRSGTGVITGNSFDAMTGSCYGSKPTVMFSVENAQRADGGHGCCTGYMCWHQPGSGSDGTGGKNNLSAGQLPGSAFQISEPIWIWANTGPGAAENLFVMGEGQPAQCGTSHTTAEFFQRGRDYFLNAGAKPGWTRYTYPHPITTGGGGTTPPPPGNDFGETAILPTAALLGACQMDAQPAVLAAAGMLQSVSVYVPTAGSNFIAGVYDAAGVRVAQTASTPAVVGWNTAAVVTPVQLAAGTYRLAVVNSGAQGLNLRYTTAAPSGTTAGGACAPPAQFPAGNPITAHWSIYATVTGGTPPPPTQLPAPTNFVLAP